MISQIFYVITILQQLARLLCRKYILCILLVWMKHLYVGIILWYDCRMKKCGIPCPSVVLLKKHILVMSFIGEGQCPAPKLKDAKLSDAEYELAYDQCVQVCPVVRGYILLLIGLTEH